MKEVTASTYLVLKEVIPISLAVTSEGTRMIPLYISADWFIRLIHILIGPSIYNSMLPFLRDALHV